MVAYFCENNGDYEGVKGDGGKKLNKLNYYSMNTVFGS